MAIRAAQKPLELRSNPRGSCGAPAFLHTAASVPPSSRAARHSEPGRSLFTIRSPQPRSGTNTSYSYSAKCFCTSVCHSFSPMVWFWRMPKLSSWCAPITSRTRYPSSPQS